MNTWSSKHLRALSIILLLGACDVIDSENGLLANLTPPEDVALPPVPLTQAMMMHGKVTLLPPRGYCIDPNSLTQSFALMARCDKLGAGHQGSGVPVGVLSVSLARSAKDTAIPTAQEIATAAGLTEPKNVRQGNNTAVFKTTGNAPLTDLSSAHWRSITQLNGFTISAALYGPKGRRAVSPEGVSILTDMIKRTTSKTNAS